jgi:hypothetical protein
MSNVIPKMHLINDVVRAQRFPQNDLADGETWRFDAG